MNPFSHLFQLSISPPACSFLSLLLPEPNLPPSPCWHDHHHHVPKSTLPSMGHNCSEHTCEALTPTSVPETPQWFLARLCGLLGHLCFAAAESLFLGCLYQLISCRASLCTFRYCFSYRYKLRAALIYPEELKIAFTA